MIYMKWYAFVLMIIFIIVLVAVITFFIVRTLFKKQLQKNPILSEDVVRTMMAQMGRTPSEKQVKAVMRSINDNQK